MIINYKEKIIEYIKGNVLTDYNTDKKIIFYDEQIYFTNGLEWEDNQSIYFNFKNNKESTKWIEFCKENFPDVKIEYR